MAMEVRMAAVRIPADQEERQEPGAEEARRPISISWPHFSQVSQSPQSASLDKEQVFKRREVNQNT